MKVLKSILPHATIVLGCIFTTFLILDTFNPTMDWVGNSISTVLLYVFCAVAVACGVMLSYENRKASDQREQQRYVQGMQANVQRNMQQSAQGAWRGDSQGRHSGSPTSPYQDGYSRIER